MPEQRPRSPREDTNRRMLRARDEMDRRFAEPLDIPALAAVAHLSPSQFGRVFKDVYGETPPAESVRDCGNAPHIGRASPSLGRGVSGIPDT